MWKELQLKFFKSGNAAMLYIGINVLIFVVVSLLGVVFLLSRIDLSLLSFINRYLAFPTALETLPYRFYTVITYQFFHANFFHLLFNMLWLYWLGQIFLSFLKNRQFHFVYLGGGIMGALTFLAMAHALPMLGGQSATLIGASASVMAIVVATATLVPDYSIRLLLFGELRLKYLVLAYVLLDIIGIGGTNAGGNIAHLGGALFGFTYIRFLKSGKDWAAFLTPKPRMKVVKNTPSVKGQRKTDQREIDAILDKISKSGYDRLTKEEKETLFKASKD